MKIINLEINEISPILFLDFIEKNPDSILAKIKDQKLLDIYTTSASDVKKNKLYPSQTWASFNTGIPYSKHKCYWYSDELDYKSLLWYKLLEKKIKIGIIGSLHSSKLPNELYKLENFKFIIPDCFSNKKETFPNKYTSFQQLNNLLVERSSRITNLPSLIKSILKFAVSILIFPRKFGISKFSFLSIIKIVIESIVGNKENIRMAQFPLIGSIYKDLIIQNKPDYSSLFSNHVAGSMHRYWYAYNYSQFINKNKYNKSWIKKNRKSIPLGLSLLDEYIKDLYKSKFFQNNIILITSSMGQEANPKFDNKKLSMYDGKITNINKFLNKLISFQKQKLNLKLKFKVERNMAPQYGFDFSAYKNLDLEVVKNSIQDFVNFIGLQNKVDIQGHSLVLTIDPHVDYELQSKYNLKEVSRIYKPFGFSFFPITDHHSGSHSPYGLLAVINGNEKIKKIISDKCDSQKNINYLDYKNIIIEYFQ